MPAPGGNRFAAGDVVKPKLDIYSLEGTLEIRTSQTSRVVAVMGTRSQDQKIRLKGRSDYWESNLFERVTQ